MWIIDIVINIIHIYSFTYLLPHSSALTYLRLWALLALAFSYFPCLITANFSCNTIPICAGLPPVPPSPSATHSQLVLIDLITWPLVSFEAVLSYQCCESRAEIQSMFHRHLVNIAGLTQPRPTWWTLQQQQKQQHWQQQRIANGNRNSPQFFWLFGFWFSVLWLRFHNMTAATASALALYNSATVQHCNSARATNVLLIFGYQYRKAKQALQHCKRS